MIPQSAFSENTYETFLFYDVELLGFSLHTRVSRQARVKPALPIRLSLYKVSLLLIEDPKYVKSSTTSY